jgi:hypothetical protein
MRRSVLVPSFVPWPVYVVTCRRAREGWDGTTGGTITHGDACVKGPAGYAGTTIKAKLLEEHVIGAVLNTLEPRACKR